MLNPSDIASGICGEGLTFVLTEEGTLTISGAGAMEDYHYYSSSYTPWYSNRANIKEVVIDNSVTSIGDYAFKDCDSLTSITIPDGVDTINDFAFQNCDSLTSVTIGGDVNNA